MSGKIVIPLNDSAGLYEEMDAYRKKCNDTLYFQMNIISNVEGDSIAKRHGKLLLLNNKMLQLGTNPLSDIQIDSITKSWGIDYLVRQR